MSRYDTETLAFVKEQLAGKIINLTPLTYGNTRDVYGLLQSYIWVSEVFHELFNETLLQKGYARPV